VATYMVTQLRLIDSSVISLHLIIYRRVQQTAAVELHNDKQQLGREEEGRPMGSRVGITRLGDLSMLWITIYTKASNPR
jgi:hypothetical protein